MSKAEFVRELVRTNPLLIPHTLKNPDYDSRITHAIMYDLLPFKLGIEIECGGNLVRRKYGLPEWGGEFYKLMRDQKDIYNLDSFTCDTGDGVTDYCEHRIRILGYKQITGLYRILEDMKKYCMINTSSGIHIHVDFSDCFGENYFSRKGHLGRFERIAIRNRIVKSKEKAIEEFKKYLQEVVEFFQYKGTYSYHRVTDSKLGVISFREETVEFRCGNCSFDYEKIVSELIYVSQLCKKVKKHFGKHY